MENREILIANTKTQKRSKITTNATTLGELKDALIANHIDYSGMTFTEGISKTQLLDDSTQLPQNVMYKGNPTNNLVILLTNTKKNIASGGMSRQEIYAVIKEKGLQDNIKLHFRRNFTQVPTASLEEFIASTSLNQFNTKGSDNDIDKSYSDNDRIYDALFNLLSALHDTEIINKRHLYEVVDSVFKQNAETITSSDSNITEDDIDQMIADLQD